MRIILILLSIFLSTVAGRGLGTYIGRRKTLARISGTWKLVLFLTVFALLAWLFLMLLDVPLEYVGWVFTFLGSFAFGEAEYKDHV